MPNVRIIPRLDIKGKNLIKGVHLEGLRVVGDPHLFAKEYYDQGADELLFMDAVASLYQRNHLSELITKIAQDIFIPITVGGGIRTVDDARSLLRAGADKIALNTAAIKRPGLITELAQTFGTQAIVLSIEARRSQAGQWEAMTDGGREHSGLDVEAWVRQAVSLGVGEILVTSIDQEGTQSGFDIELIKKISSLSQVPLIACGGMGKESDAIQAVTAGKADAICGAHVFHYKKMELRRLGEVLRQNGLRVRNEAI